jgi:hypothetical protein
MSDQSDSNHGATASFSGFNFNLPPGIKGFNGAVVIITAAYLYTTASPNPSLAQTVLSAAAFGFAVASMVFVRWLELKK